MEDIKTMIGEIEDIKTMTSAMEDIKNMTGEIEDITTVNIDIGNIQILELSDLLLEGENCIDATNESKQTALMMACDEGSLEKVVSLIRHGASLDLIDSQEMSALMYACKRGFGAIVHLLIEKGASIYNVHSWKGYCTSGLDIALEYGHLSIAKYIIVQHTPSCNVFNMVNHKDMSSLMLACANGYEEIVELIMSKGADIDLFQPYSLATALMNACENKHMSIAMTLMKNNANIDAVDRLGNTALMHACDNTMIEVVDLMLNSEVDSKIALHCLLTCTHSNTNTSTLFRVLEYFAKEGRQRVICDYIEQFSRFDESEVEHQARLVFNCMFDNFDWENDSSEVDEERVFSFISENIDGICCELRHWLCAYPMDDMIVRRCIDAEKLGSLKLMFEYKYDLTKYLSYDYDPLEEGYMPVVYAIKQNKIDIATWLLGTLTQDNIQGSFNDLCDYGLNEGVDFLLKKNGVDIDVTIGIQQLTLACKHQHYEVVQLLIDHGADVNLKTSRFSGTASSGMTAMGELIYRRYDDAYYQKSDNAFKKTFDILLQGGADLDVVFDVEDQTTVFAQAIRIFHINREPLECLIATGKLMDSNNRLKAIHSTSAAHGDYTNIYRIVEVLVQHGIFEWCIFTHKESIEIIMDAIKAGLSPGYPISDKGEPLSPLVSCFQDNEWTLTLHILDKLYFLPEDYKALTSECSKRRTDSISEEKDADEKEKEDKRQLKEFNEILHRVLDKPQRLRDICFLCVSNAISVKYSPCARKEMVETLPLPKPVKEHLMFM